MTKLMVDAQMASKIQGIKDQFFLCDPSGQILGRVVPPSPYDNVVIPFTEEELSQAEEEMEEFSFAEILAELEKK